MTQFSFEVPIKHLEDFDDLQDFYFLLSVLWRESEEYRKFMSTKHPRLKWMDNSYNEQMTADKISSLVKCKDESEASKVICPDNPSWTAEEIKLKFLEMQSFYPVNELIVVVKGEEMYKELLQAGAKNFAVSYWTRPKPVSFPRDTWMHNVHYLGLLTLDELMLVEPPTCDTSMPIKVAMQHKTMVDWVKEGCPHINTKDLGLHGSSFFNSTLDKQTLWLARENIMWLKEHAGDE